MTISVIIAALNDPDIYNTVQSCFINSTEKVEVIVVDDNSAEPIHALEGCNMRVHRSPYRLGVGPARHLAAHIATGDILFIVDAHCRFSPGWDVNLIDALTSQPHALICGQMIALDSDNMRMDNGRNYFGATFNFFGPDQNKKTSETQVFEAVWRRKEEFPETHTEGYPIPACMGACYGMMRVNYLRLGGLQYLRHWGCDEQLLSLKFSLFAGGVQFDKGIQIGHKFRTGREKIPFAISNAAKIYNKLFCIHTLLPEPQAKLLASKIPASLDKSAALKSLVENWGIVEAERAHNWKLAGGHLDQRFAWYLRHFNLEFPNK